MRHKVLRSKNAGKPSVLASFIVASTLVFDGLDVLVIGFIIFAIAGLGSPAVGVTKASMLRKGEIIFLMPYIYFWFCVLSPIL